MLARSSYLPHFTLEYEGLHIGGMLQIVKPKAYLVDI